MRNFLLSSLYYLFLLQSISQPSYAQSPKLSFEHLTIENGLSNNVVTSIVQDQKGYLWFGTHDGLNRYDGYSFTTYEHDPQDTTSLNQNSIFSLLKDKDGNIWVGTAENGINKFNRATGKFGRYQPEQDTSTFTTPFQAVSAFTEDNEGYLWVGTWQGELRRFDKKNGKLLSQQFNIDPQQKRNEEKSRDMATFAINRAAVYCLYKDRAGTIWVGNTSGLHQINLSGGKAGKPSKASITHYRHEPDNANSLSSNFVTSVFEDKAGVLWVGTDGGGLNRFDSKTNIFTHYRHDPKSPHSISSNTVFRKSITEDQTGNLWIGTDKGLNKLNPERTGFTSYTHNPDDPSSISNDQVTALFLDASGILWVGTSMDGISKLDLHEKPFKHYLHNPADAASLSNNNVTSLAGKRKNIIWIGTLGGGLNALNLNTGKFRHYRHEPGNPESIRSDSIYDVLENNDGSLWIRSSKSLTLFYTGSGRFVHYLYAEAPYQRLGEDQIFLMYADRQGLLWLGTPNGLKSFDRNTGEINHYRYDPNKGLGDHLVIKIFQDSKDNIWVGHWSAGLSKLNKKTGVFTRYLPDPTDSTSLSTSAVGGIYEDTEGIFWFGTVGGGLYRFDPKTEVFTTYTKKHGLPDNAIHSIQEDENRNLWLGTETGISRFTPDTKTFRNYDFGDGMPSGMDRFISHKGADGKLYYGGKNGLVALAPMEIKSNRFVPPVVISKFRLFDKLIPGKEEAEEIVLKYDENFFSFEFSALNFRNSSKNQYAYQLVGVDKGWVYSGSGRIASYTEVRPGIYVFRVKGSNNDGLWNNEGVSVRIIIQPPWWRTWWAYTFYALCFFAVVLAVDKTQRKRLIQKEREKAREKELAQAREIERAYQELKQTQAQLIQKEKMASLGEMTAGIAHEIQNPLNFVNNFSELSQELVDELREVKKKETPDLALEEELLEDLEKNLSKIHHHGRRADAIVKNMLQHSRYNSGERQLTNLNALVDEYLRLAYAGVKAKDKNFTCTIDTCYDPKVGEVEVVPQELGRVFINLFNNAFYAVQQKQRLDLPDYKPQVRVSTRQLAVKVEVHVLDNGTGIQDKVLGKIFQPFFTTKPTGQGVGLGLSLSYDIITKLHGGELSVATEEGEWTEFSIVLPLVQLDKDSSATSTAPPPPADTFPKP